MVNKIYQDTEIKGALTAANATVSGGIEAVNIQASGNILTASLTIGDKSLLDFIYPVGSVYTSTKNTSPIYFVGGEWTQIPGRVLIGAGTSDATYTGGATGGTSTQKHSSGNITADIGTSAGSYLTFNINNALNSSYKNFKLAGTTTPDYNSTNMDAVTTHGETASASNMPPYLVVYMWKRTK